MTNRPSVGRRAARLLAFSVGGGVALAIAMASASSAQEVVVQDAEVVNVGGSVANSGGNLAVGNASDNASITAQGAVGLLASNAAGGGGNSSSGTATVQSGSATAVGNQSTTGAAQSVTGGGGAGPTIAVQDADTVNLGGSVANSGLNAAVGNASDNLAVTAQGSAGLVASNAAGGGNASSGTASVTTGAASATGNQSGTAVSQTTATGGGGGGLLVAVQDADTVNLGGSLTNTGLNLSLGNTSDNASITAQGALGLLASNVAGGGNSSSGTSTVVTGSATGIGNRSDTGVAQSVLSDPPGLAVVLQSAPAVNLGGALVNAGLNGVVANDASDFSLLIQGAVGLIANNAGGGGNTSSGVALLLSGNGLAIGNDARTWVSQQA